MTHSTAIRHPLAGRARARLAWVAMALVVVVACARTPPEQAVRDATGELAAAIRDRDAEAVAGHLADDFVGPDGLDRRGASRLALLAFRRHQQVAVALGPVDIDVRGTRATVRTTAVLTGGQGLLPESARAYEVVGGWRDEGGRWKLTSLDWSAQF